MRPSSDAALPAVALDVLAAGILGVTILQDHHLDVGSECPASVIMATYHAHDSSSAANATGP